ncbi:MAG: phosphomannomutase [Desulfuromonas sp.]|mgnify:CR=1 FL=1|nr:MAG: phosphomannomutase [Desulfuromonas sp.]
MQISCFKAYDVRGRMPDELNEEVARRIGRAYAEFIKPEKVVVGHDMRLSSRSLTDALIKGLVAGGVNVYDIGLCGTEEVYFATFFKEMDGGIMVTASHNPADYNGMKFVREKSIPISADTGLEEIRSLAEKNEIDDAAKPGEVKTLDVKAEYIRHLLGYVSATALKPLKVVVNAGNGCAGPIIDLLEPHLPFEFVRQFHEPDGTFPNGIPNPLLEENRQATAEAVLGEKADVGIAWDGDFDRCFFFDEKARFIEGYYVVGMLAEVLLKKNPGGKIVHDPRLTWNTIDIVKAAGGVAVQCKSGHAFIKEMMRREDAVYGGEMSAHHYFREFSYCDSGMIPWLLVLQLMSETGKTLSELVDECIEKYPASGEINRKLSDADQAMDLIYNQYAGSALHVDTTDGYSFEYPEWRFNLRKSNTEPLVRLNVESRGDIELMKAKTGEILSLLQ